MSKALTIAHLVWRDLLRRKDVYVASMLMLAMVVFLMSLDVFGMQAAARYVTEVGLLLTWLCSIVLTLSLAVRQLPNEERSGTIYPLLAKPLRRGSLIIGKWLGAWVAGITATLFFYLLSMGVVFVRGGAVDAETLGQGMLLHGGMLAILAALALALSTRLSQAAAATLCYLIAAASLFFAPRIPHMAAEAAGFRQLLFRITYYLLPHFELFDLRRRIVHGWGTAPWKMVAASMLYATVWSALLLVVAWLAYRRKFFRRGALS